MAKPIGPIAEVTWTDAWSRDKGWASVEDYMSDAEYTVTTVGYLIERSRHRVRLAMQYAPEAEMMTRMMTIPRGMVQSIRILG